jgi:hypothetical protein
MDQSCWIVYRPTLQFVLQQAKILLQSFLPVQLEYPFSLSNPPNVAHSSTEISFLTADTDSWPNIVYMMFQAKCVCANPSSCW